MKIGVIGSGGAGLTVSWLLQGHHEVTLFEKENRLGGHADTVEVEQDGEIFPVDAGFEFFYDAMFTRFNRLLFLIGAAVHKFPASVTLYDSTHRRTTLLPPFNRERIVWSAYNPRAIGELLRFQRVISQSIPLIDRGDPFITVKEYLNTLNLSEDFLSNFLYPFLLAEWCVELEEFKTFSAYNVLKYIVTSRPQNLQGIVYASEVVGGTRAYVKAMQAQLTQTRILMSSDITHLSQTDKQFTVHDANSGSHTFDHLIIATSAAQASSFLKPFAWAEKRRDDLDRISYFKTTIAVHSDPRFMPANPDHWSVVNTRYETTHSSNTFYKKWRSKRPIFRSWVTYDQEMPTSLYHIRTYDHLKITLEHFRAQRNLIPQQGENNLWLAGLYMHDIDCHESAVMSAVNVAQKLDPQSDNLRKLLESTE